MKSQQVLRAELISLRRRLQAHYNTITYHKRGANLIAAMFNPHLRRQSLFTVTKNREDIENILPQIQDVQEQLFAVVFLECLKDELSRLPDSIFLPK